MARQRHCRRLARNGKPGASLLTPSSSEPRTPAGKARVLDARKWLRERDGLSAGGRWIRTIGTPPNFFLITHYPQPSRRGTKQEHTAVSAGLNDGAQQGAISKGA